MAMFRSRSRTVQIPIGKRLRAQDGSLWEIACIVPVNDEVPHVRLVSTDDATAIKILSVEAIFDKCMFRLAN